MLNYIGDFLMNVMQHLLSHHLQQYGLHCLQSLQLVLHPKVFLLPVPSSTVQGLSLPCLLVQIP
uniref:Uncharacterized protein n=1 Tax=Arundo donax TaxID=35708 RepID=A0A0A9EV27_ARUDO